MKLDLGAQGKDKQDSSLGTNLGSIRRMFCVLAGYIIPSAGPPPVISPHISSALASSITLLPERYRPCLNRPSLRLDPAREISVECGIEIIKLFVRDVSDAELGIVMLFELANRLAQTLRDGIVQCAPMPRRLVTEGEHDPRLVRVVGHTGVPRSNVSQDHAASLDARVAGRPDLAPRFDLLGLYADDARDDVVVFRDARRTQPELGRAVLRTNVDEIDVECHVEGVTQVFTGRYQRRTDGCTEEWEA